jgi:hypothetical protein
MATDQASYYTFPQGGARLAIPAAVATPSNLFGNLTWQIGGVYNGIVPIAFPTFSGGPSSQTFTVNLGFPQVTLPSGASGIVNVSTYLTQFPSPTPVIGIPYLLLQVRGGAATQQTGGRSSFTLSAGRTYSGFSLYGEVTAFSTASIPAFTLYLGVQAILLGVPSST